MAFPLSTPNQRSNPLNPNAQSFQPAFSTTIGLQLSHQLYHPQQLLPLALPFEQSQAWPLMGFHFDPSYGHPGQAEPNGFCEAVFYDVDTQPQTGYTVSKSEGGMVAEKLRDVEEYQTFGCGRKVDREPKGLVVGPRLVSQRKSPLNFRQKIWMPKKTCGGESGGDGLLPSPPFVHESTTNFNLKTKNMNMGNKLKRGISGIKRFAPVVPFPTTIDEVQRSGITTVMIKNIPNQFTRKTLLNILDKHCREENQKTDSGSCTSAYDFVYLPMDFMKCWDEGKTANLGYAFVNFTNAVAAFRFYNAFHKYEWEVNQNKKTCEVTVAKLQGKEDLSGNFTHSRFWCRRNTFMPVVFDPPRDGSDSKCMLMTIGVHQPKEPAPRNPWKLLDG
ncbi:protein terminal ear1 like [Fagus crenata]